MSKVKDVRAKYRKLHDKQSNYYYQRKHAGLTDETEDNDFLAWHKKLYEDMEAELRDCEDFVEPVIEI